MLTNSQEVTQEPQGLSSIRPDLHPHRVFSASPGHTLPPEPLPSAPRCCLLLLSQQEQCLASKNNTGEHPRLHPNSQMLRKRLLKGQCGYFSLSSVCFLQHPGSHLKQGQKAQRSALKELRHSTCWFDTGGESLLAPLQLQAFKLLNT